MRILVTGSRNYPHWNQVNEALLAACAGHGNIVIIHGACPTGADALADRFVAYQRVRVERYPADWDTHGRAAGPKRNAHMVSLGADVCLAFIGNCTSPRCRINGEHPSHGASGCADLAEAAGIPTRRFSPPIRAALGDA